MEEKDAALIQRYLRGECTPEESAKVEAWYNSQVKQRRGSVGEADYARYFVESLDVIHQARKAVPVKRFPWLRVVAAAAIFLATLSLGYRFLFQPGETEQPIVAADIAPGRNRAMLTLADGRTITLDEAQSGVVVGDVVTYQDGRGILPIGDEASPAAASEPMMISTPRGGQYQITLADGTDVWLNAESTLRYPSQFGDGERVVEVDGEAYFAVAQDANKPFKVISRGQTVEVLGTEFNISAYADEPQTQITLVTGKVRVKPDEATAEILQPGQQAIVDASAIRVENIDVGQYTAWKTGYFYFNGDSPEGAFAQLSRWYDIEVVYEGQVPSVAFYGKIERDKPLGSLLNILEKAGLDFEVVRQGDKHRLIIGGE